MPSGGNGLSAGQIAGVVIGTLGMNPPIQSFFMQHPLNISTNPSPALLLLLTTSIFALLRRRRRSPTHAPGFWAFLNHPPTPPPLAVETEKDDTSLLNPNPMTITKPKPTATRLSKWLTDTFHHHPSSHGTPPSPLPPNQDLPLSPTPSLLSLPTTIHTRHTNSTFLPTTALHYPKGSGSGRELLPHPLQQHPLSPLAPSTTTTTSSQMPDGSRDTMQVLLSEPPPPRRERNGGGGNNGGGFLRPISVMELRLSGLGG